MDAPQRVPEDAENLRKKNAKKNERGAKKEDKKNRKAGKGEELEVVEEEGAQIEEVTDKAGADDGVPQDAAQIVGKGANLAKSTVFGAVGGVGKVIGKVGDVIGEGAAAVGGATGLVDA